MGIIKSQLYGFKSVKFFVFSLILIFPWIFLWQDGDFTDSGFLLTKFHFFFDDLKIGRQDSPMFLTVFIGGVWDYCFPAGGILSFKILYYIFYLCLVHLSILFVKQYSSINSSTLFVIFIALLFGERYWMFVFSYDILSYVLLGYTAYFLSQGLLKRERYLYLSGFLLALSVLAKISNLVFVFFVPFIVAYYLLFIKRECLKRIISVTLNYTLKLLIGFLALGVLFFIVLKYTNNYQNYLKGFTLLNSARSHGLKTLIWFYLRDLNILVPHLFYLGIVMFVLSINQFLQSVPYLIKCLLFVLLFMVTYFVYFGYGYASFLKFLLPAYIFTPLAISIYKRNLFGFFSLLFAGVALSAVFGTNTGLAMKLNYSFICFLPLAVHVMETWNGKTLGRYVLNTKFYIVASLIILFILTLGSRIGWMYHVGEGIDIRSAAVYRVTEGPAKGFFTTSSRLDRIKEIGEIRDKQRISASSFYVWGNEPILYYFLDKNSLYQSIWFENNAIDPNLFLEKLGSYVCQNNDLMLLEVKDWGSAETRKNFNQFLGKYHFKQVYLGKYYTLWSATKASGNHTSFNEWY